MLFEADAGAGVLVVAVLAAGAASALAQEASEARISARRLADGRIEFAL